MFAMQKRLGSLGLGYASLETAAAAAGMQSLVEGGLIDGRDSVVLFDTGAGFKSSSAPGLRGPAQVPNDVEFWRERVLPALGALKPSSAERSPSR
jgi:threonine synthase